MRGGLWGNPPPENFEILKLENATFNISFFCFLREMGAGGGGGGCSSFIIRWIVTYPVYSAVCTFNMVWVW